MPTWPRVDVLARVRVDRVGQAALLAHLLEQARRGRAAEDRVEHAQREAALVAARDARARRGRGGTARSPSVEAQRAASRPRAPAGRRRRRPSPRASPRRRSTSSTSRSCSTLPAAATTRFDRARSARRGRPRSRGTGTVAITSARPITGRPSGWSPKTAVGEHVVHLVRGLVLVHRDLLDHDLALGVDVRVGRAQHHVRPSRRTRARGAGRGSASRPRSSPCRCPR